MLSERETKLELALVVQDSTMGFALRTSLPVPEKNHATYCFH